MFLVGSERNVGFKSCKQLGLEQLEFLGPEFIGPFFDVVVGHKYLIEGYEGAKVLSDKVPIVENEQFFVEKISGFSVVESPLVDFVPGNEG